MWIDLKKSADDYKNVEFKMWQKYAETRLICKNTADNSVFSEAGFYDCFFLFFSFHCPWLSACSESEHDRVRFEEICDLADTSSLFQLRIFALKEQHSDAALVQIIKKNKTKPQW